MIGGQVNGQWTEISNFESYSHPQSVPHFFFFENDLVLQKKLTPAKAIAAITMVKTVVD